MFTISKEIEWDAGHRVPRHESKCRNPHGHRYKVRVTIKGELITEGPETGMVKDFGNLKLDMQRLLHDRWDHGFVIWRHDIEMAGAFALAKAEHNVEWNIVYEDFMPTAECFARKCWELMEEAGYDNLVEIALWETPTSVAYYHGGK